LETDDGGLEDDDDADLDDPVIPRKAETKRDRWDEKIRQHIESKSREELAALACDLVDRYPDLKDEFRERIALGEGDADRLIAEARREICRVTAQDAWRNGWTGEGNLPDYSKVKHRLERLVDLGQADAVVRLGRELIERGMEQVGRSNDEGETAAALGECMPLVFDAVRKSGLKPAAKLLFAIDAALADDYGILDGSDDGVLGEAYATEVWSTVADQLMGRLSTHRAGRPSDDEDRRDAGDYARDRITDWLGLALQRAGRMAELVSIYEAEARRTSSYTRLVAFLIEQNRHDDARRWAAEGIERTAEKLPGIASELADQLQKLASRAKQWDIVAAHAAWAFFERPGVEPLNSLIAAAAKARVKTTVRTLALRFLETGVMPISTTRSSSGKPRIVVDPDWPLPTPDHLVPLLRRLDTGNGPYFGVLIDLAIAARQPEDVLKWYDRWRAASKPSSHGYAWSGTHRYADAVAAAVVSSHPERAIEIYRAQVDGHLPQASTSAYDTVAQYLKKLRPIQEAIGRADEWTRLVQDIRERYRNRPRFMEILDRLDNRPIASAAKRLDLRKRT
jgi:uncharacterized Zn finger protein